MKIAELREIANEIGRKGVAEVCKKCVDDCDGSYKGFMELSGKLSLIAKMATFDRYWEEQVNRGVYNMGYELKFGEFIKQFKGGQNEPS